MSNIDQRIVDMQFKNEQFEKGIESSVKSLDNLKSSLKLDGAAQGLGNLERIGRNFTLGGISDAVRQVSDRFTALEIIGVTALANITNQAVNAGKRIVSALTIDPIRTGFQEYELKMGAIQTIMAGTGESLETVNKYLEELNEYSDRTIYSFSDMTQNIGKFTNAGVDLETAVLAIKGISNEAALSGANANEAARAMYNLSQAISMGYVQLIDWKSIENANMGTIDFKNNLLDTAMALGTVKKAADGGFITSTGKHFINAQQMFKDGLQQQWLTTEVMLQTLTKYSDETTELGKKAYAAAQDVKTISQMFDTMKESVQSGWAMTWEYIIGDKEQAVETLTKINNAFSALIEPTTEARNAMLEFWNKNGGREAIIEGFAHAFKVLGSVLSKVTEAFREVFPAMTGERLVEFSKNLSDLLKRFKVSERTLNNIKGTFKGLFSVIDVVATVLLTFAKGVAMLFGAVLPASAGVLDLTNALGKFFTNISESIKSSNIFSVALENLSKALDKLPNLFDWAKYVPGIFLNIANTVGRALGVVQDFISKGIGKLNFDSIFSVLNSGLFAAILLGVKKFVGSITEFTNAGGGFLSNIGGILNDVRGSLQAYQEQLKAGTLLKIASAVGILAASLFVISKIDSDKLGTSLTAISVLFGELIMSIGLLEKSSMGMGIKSTFTLTTVLIALSTALLLLSTSLLIISRLDLDDLAKGLLGIGVLLGEMIGFMKLADASGLSMKSAASLVLLSGALVLMATAVRILGTMDITSLAKGLGTIAILLGEMILFMKISGDPKNIIATSVGIAIMAGAMLIFAAAIGALGSMSILTLAKGLGALATALAILAIAMKFMQGSLAGAAAMVLLSTAIAILVPALFLLGSMPIKKIVKGLLTIAALFALVGVAAIVLAPLTPVIYSLAAAIAVLGLSILAIGAGVLLFSTAMTALSVSGAAGATALVAIITSVASMIPFIIKKIGEGIIELAKVIGDGAPEVAKAAMKLIQAVLDSIFAKIPDLIKQGVDIVVAIVDGIVDGLPKIIQAGFDLAIAFINGVADAISGNTDEMLEAMGNLVTAIIKFVKEALKKAIPGFIQIGKDILGGLVKGLKDGKPDVEKAGARVAGDLVRAANKKLEINSPSKVFSAMAKNVISGLVNGLDSDKPKNEIEKISDSMMKAFDTDINTEPTIRPILDLSGFKKSIDGAMEKFDKVKTLNLTESHSRFQKIAPVRNFQNGYGSLPELATVGAGDTYNITVSGNYISEDYDIDRIAQQLTNRLSRDRRRYI